MNQQKYELTGETLTVNRGSVKVYRIRALRTIGEGDLEVKQGDLGGFVESEQNLAHDGDSWVSDNAYVYENALVSGNARVSGGAEISGNARVLDNARVFNSAEIGDYVVVGGNARVGGNAKLFGHDRLDDDAVMTGNKPVYGLGNVQTRYGAKSPSANGVQWR